MRLNPALEYSVELPDLVLPQNTLVAGVQAEYDVASEYHATHCFVDKDHRFNPSVYEAPRLGADLFCVESLMLREGLTVDSFGELHQQGKAPLFGDGDELRIGSFFQLTTTLPHDIGVVLGGRVDYNGPTRRSSAREWRWWPLRARRLLEGAVQLGLRLPGVPLPHRQLPLRLPGQPHHPAAVVRTVEAWSVGRATGCAPRSGYYNEVSRFITFDLPLSARTGQFKFSNEGDLLSSAPRGPRCSASSRGSCCGPAGHPRPAAGRHQRAFLVDGQLGGPTKYPQLIGGRRSRACPSRLRLTSTAHQLAVKQTIAREVQFQGITGSDGLPHSTLDASQFDTRELTFDALASFNLTDRWRVAATATNLLDRRAYRPGSVLIPYLAEGRRVIFTLSYGY